MSRSPLVPLWLTISVAQGKAHRLTVRHLLPLRRTAADYSNSYLTRLVRRRIREIFGCNAPIRVDHVGWIDRGLEVFVFAHLINDADHLSVNLH